MIRPTLNMHETAYLIDEAPIFDRVFLRAMSFHFPEGLAAVRDHAGAYHINLSGEAAYRERYQDSAGFYEGAAAVRDARGWFHIGVEGRPLHMRRFQWSGNFQEGRCPVQDSRGFAHVRLDGTDAYPQRYSYVGDFKAGLAVAHASGQAFHIRLDGTPLNGKRYSHAEPFHKGFAVVRDEGGSFHVDRSGEPLHSMRFSTAEPFYNGVALCRTLAGEIVRLRENGSWNRVARELATIDLASLRSLLVSGSSVGLYIRHAERFAIDSNSPSWGNEVLLTARGVEVAARLGYGLRGLGSLAFRSSPIQRCRQTCLAIAEGAGISSPEILLDTELGHPGFLIDGTGAHAGPMKQDYHAFTGELLATGHAPGMKPMTATCERIVAELRAQMSGAACTFFLTHDLFAAALMSHLGLKAPTADDWCDYLEGVCLIGGPSGPAFRRFAGESAIP